ncbi:MAG: hypothetical protein HYW86_04250 [Candidatus Roizmanbacteria bacterium]|nr:MAG: hypothetical protein HYW86_04250 [Candidatus Roizmanbacteria bacterium]
MKKIILAFLFLIVSTFLVSNVNVEARNTTIRSYSSSSRNVYKYTTPRNQIYVPKTQTVKPYFKSNGTYVPSYQRAPYGSLKPYYAPGYPQKKIK